MVAWQPQTFGGEYEYVSGEIVWPTDVQLRHNQISPFHAQLDIFKEENFYICNYTLINDVTTSDT